VTVDWSRYRAVLFDLDGVLTPTAEVHMRAWAEMFNAFLDDRGRVHPDEPAQAAYTDADYFAYVDGKPRYDGVRDFLASRHIALVEGSDDDPASATTVKGLGNRKNDAFNIVLERDGVTAYPGSVALLDHLRDLGLPLAVVSSSANAPSVLEAAGLADRFGTVVSGTVAAQLGLPGKPSPDTFVHAAEVLGASVADCVVLEDAVSGVRAGRAGDFGLVVGVDRGAGRPALIEAGADLVVADLAELVPDSPLPSEAS
jgi:beta-phosphoglucomutase family hydrolase